MSEIRVLADAHQLAQAAAQHVMECAQQAIATHGYFSIALSGGSTPKALFQLLAAPDFSQQLEWTKIHIFWGDERCVPPDHADSNYRMTRETLLNHVLLPPANIYRIRGEANPAEAAEEYEGILKAFFKSEWPRFDLILLGMGDDGHTASLFPHTKALHEKQRWVVANYLEAKQIWRITLTALAINAAANIAFLISGAGKAERLKQVLQGAFTPDELPSQLIKPTNGNLAWLLDADSAAQLK